MIALKGLLHVYTKILCCVNEFVKLFSVRETFTQ